MSADPQADPRAAAAQDARAPGVPARDAIDPVAEPAARRQVAVALRHDRDGALPRIVATGRGAVAEQILELAFASGVKVREDADLAEILSVIDVDSEIPVEAIAAVAEILAHLYRANGAAAPSLSPSGSGRTPVTLPETAP